MDEYKFKELHRELELSHHPYRRSLLYLKWAFKFINFKDKRVLDIGGGNGIYSYYAKFKGAKYCLNLEPFADGSKNVKRTSNNPDNVIQIDTEPLTFQEFETSSKFDIIILHDSINHLDEEKYCLLHKEESAFKSYSALISKIGKIISNDGKVLVSDCSRLNFFGFLGIKNPVAPSIEWHIHQHPTLLTELFNENGFKLVKLRWSPFKRFDKFGHLLSRFGFPVAYFMQSHFNMVFSK